MKCKYEADWYKQLLHGEREYRHAAYARGRNKLGGSEFLHMLRNSIHTMFLFYIFSCYHIQHIAESRWAGLENMWLKIQQRYGGDSNKLRKIKINNNTYICIYIYMCPSMLLFAYTCIALCLHRYTYVCVFTIRCLSVCSYILICCLCFSDRLKCFYEGFMKTCLDIFEQSYLKIPFIYSGYYVLYLTAIFVLTIYDRLHT